MASLGGSVYSLYQHEARSLKRSCSVKHRCFALRDSGGGQRQAHAARSWTEGVGVLGQGHCTWVGLSQCIGMGPIYGLKSLISCALRGGRNP
jgi:hypothetical protein